jgi:lipopolysaccharide export system protein LptA
MDLNMRLLQIAVLIAATALPNLGGPAWAEGTGVAFGGLTADISLPVEVTADSFSVNQTDATAVFAGNVIVTQGEMRMTAQEIKVEYAADGKGIAKLIANGSVVLVNAKDAAQANMAVYTIASGEVVMTGDVVLTQGQAAMSGQRLVIDLKTGTGRMEGRVTTIFTPGNN